MSAPAVSFVRVSKRYGDGPLVLEEVSVEIPAEGVSFVVGRSGAGKSVLCRLAVGLERPDFGTIALFGTRLNGLRENRLLPLRRMAPYLVQGPALLDWLSLEQNVAMADPDKDKARVDRALGRVGLLELAGKLPTQVGPGVRKRAAIARALALEPRFLFFDEPTTGLDKPGAKQISDVLQALRQEGLGALVVSHDYPLLRRIADRVILVEDRTVRAFATRDAFLSSQDAVVRELLAPTEAESSRHG